MSETLPAADGACCQACDSPVTTQVPGPAGAAGAPGTNGTNGRNAYTTTAAQFTMPAVSANVSVQVVSSDWATVGQVVVLSTAGSFSVNSKPDATHISLTNLGYSGNAAPTTVIATSQTVSPGGLRGPTGASGANTLNDISPTMTKGDLIVDNGANNPLASDTRLPAGADKLVLTADSALPLGVGYKSVDLTGTNTAISGVLPIANGGTGQVRPAAIQGAAKNLVIATIPAGTFAVWTQVGISADQVVLMKSDGNARLAAGVTLTLDAAGTVGSPLGLDTGTFNSSTLYYIWLIYNGTTVSAVFSASYTAPTLVSGALSSYTYTAFLGSVYSDASSHFLRSIQYGNRVAVEETVVFTDQTGSTTFTQTNLPGLVPPFAKTFSGTVGVSTETTAPWGMVITSDSDGIVGAMTFNDAGANTDKLNGFFHAVPFTDLVMSSSPPNLNWKTKNAAANQYRATINGYTI